MKIIVHIALIAFCITSYGCKKADIKGVSNLNGNEIAMLGHGGMGIASSYPMDTYESLTEAITIGADGVEIDVQMTSDSVLVGFHNNELDKNTSCVGKINEHTWEEIQACEYVQEIFGLHQIISIQALFNKWSIDDERIIVFDCKLIANANLDAFIVAYANALINLVETHGLADNVLIESQNIDFLLLVQSLKPNYRLFIYPGSFEDGLSIAATNNLYGITIASADATESQVEEAHSRGLRVALWNTDSRRDNVDAINKSPEYIQTDRLKNLINLLN